VASGAVLDRRCARRRTFVRAGMEEWLPIDPQRPAMIRFFFRALGLIFLAAGFVFFVYDGTKSIAGNASFYTPLSDTWNAVYAASLQQVQPVIERYAGKLAWEQVSLWVLNAPTFAVFGVIGAVLVLFGRKKKPLIGYGR
jgi:hypothetical protein